MKNSNYITIQGWMINELELSGNDLIIYALIYGFSQDGIHTFNGSLTYLAGATNMSRRGIIKAITRLVDSGLIKKIQEENHVNKYMAIFEELHKNSGEPSAPVGEPSAPVGEPSAPVGEPSALPTNIYTYTDSNMDLNTPSPTFFKLNTQRARETLEREKKSLAMLLDDPWIPVESIQDYLLSDDPWLRQVSQEKELPIGVLHKYIESFSADQKLKSANGRKDLADVRSHFINWLNLKVKSGDVIPVAKVMLNPKTRAEDLRDQQINHEIKKIMADKTAKYYLVYDFLISTGEIQESRYNELCKNPNLDHYDIIKKITVDFLKSKKNN